MSNSTIIDNSIKAVLSNENEVIISPFNFDSSKENEFLIFFKPEVFFSNDETYIKKSIDMVLSKLEQNEIAVAWAILFSGSRLDELGIMDRHYGFINKISKNLSKIITLEERNKINELLEITDAENYKIYGGHEFLESHTEFNETTLDDFWQTKKSAKVRSGFYVQKYELNGEKFVLANAFHPSQLKHYTDSSHKTLVVLCNSNKDWSELKDNVAWDTFPDNSARESIRWEFFANKEMYGLEEVSISYNCIHMSAWSFEAFFEIDNFLKNSTSADYSIDKTSLFSKISTKWFSKDEIVNLLSNPKNSQGKSLFDVTENLSTSWALELVWDFR